MPRGHDVLTLDDLLTTGARVVASRRREFARASVDTRDLQGGELFVAIAGPTRDGHDFVSAAVAAGATGVMVSRGAAELAPTAGLADVTVVEVPDPLVALQRAAAAARQRSDAQVTAITGSVGKTTTKAFTAHVLAAGSVSVLSNEASFNNELGVPLTLSRIRPEHRSAVVEIGTDHPGEIAHLAGLVDPDIAVVTGIGSAHLGNFDDRDELATEKTDLLRGTRSGGVWVVNGDDDVLVSHARALAGPAGARLVLVGFGPGNELRASGVTVDEHGTRGVVHIGEQGVDFALPVIGRHFAYPMLFALAVAREHGLDPESAITSLADVSLPDGRANYSRISDRLATLDDSYNGSPDAMLASLRLLASLPGEVKVAVLGEMGELGRFSAELHGAVGAAAAGAVTHLVTIGEQTRALVEAARRGGLAPELTWTVDSAGAALVVVREILARHTREQAVVLAKGSRFMHTERVSLGLAGREVRCMVPHCPLYIRCTRCPRMSA